MYPGEFFTLFPPFPRDDRVFVAMSFSPRFARRWTDVIEPAIKRLIPAGGVPLVPHRVDRTRAGDSILIEILREISRARLIIADVTTIGYVDGFAARNANVLYEVGLAHSVRLPEEIILIRSDSDPLPFDIANVRVHTYSPDSDPVSARDVLSGLMRDALGSVGLRRSIAVARAADSMDLEAWEVLFEADNGDIVHHPTHPDSVKQRGMLNAMLRAAAIQRLLQIGAIETEYHRLSEEFFGRQATRPKQELVSYQLTAFGRAIIRHSLEGMLAKDGPDTTVAS